MNQILESAQSSSPTAVSSDMYRLDVLELVRRKFWFIVFFALLGSSLGVLYYFKAPKTFESVAKIVVEEKTTPTLNTVDGESYITESPVEKYLEVIRSARVLNPAIEHGKFDDLKTFEDVEDILYMLKSSDENLRVKSADVKALSSVISVAFLGPEESEVQPILAGIVKSFEDYIRLSTDTDGGQKMETLQRAQAEYQERLTQLNSELSLLNQKPHLAWKDGAFNNLHQARQVQLQEDQHEVRREKTKLQARLNTIKEARDRGEDAEPMLFDALSDMKESAFGAYVMTHQQFVQLKIREQELLSEFGDQHPELVSIRGQIQMVDKMRKQELNSLRGGSPSAAVNNADGSDFVLLFLEHLANKISVLDAEEIGIQKAIEQEQTASAQIAQDVTKFSELNRERERLEKVYNETFDRLSEMKALEEVNWRTMELLDPASNPEQASPSFPISLAAGSLLGSLLGLLFAGLKDLAEKTFHSSDDIATILDSRVVGHVSLFAKQATKKSADYKAVAGEVVALHQPNSPAAETYRAIRTTLFFNSQETGAKLIQITSPIPGDGKSTTIANLAASMALSGKRVLIVDCDFRRPVQHKFFGVSNSLGITSVIYGEVEWGEVVQEIVPGALSILPCGPLPHNPAELLNSDYFPELLEELKENYDYVLLDTPPLLAVTDPSIVSPLADKLYVVLRIRNGVKINAQRAKDVLDSMKVGIAGVIVNGLRRQDSKSYNYNYGGRYGYNSVYGSNYGNSRATYGAAPATNGSANGKRIRSSKKGGSTDSSVAHSTANESARN